MDEHDKKTALNLGCGSNKIIGALNVDLYDVCEPDLVWDLNDTPWPLDTESFDTVTAHHVLEHLVDWWSAFEEIARVTKVGGQVEIAVPHESASTALGMRDHLHLFSQWSFHGIQGVGYSTSAWGEIEYESIPMRMTTIDLVPYGPYQWMAKWCPWLLRFCAVHLRNFIHTSRYRFERLETQESYDDVLSMHLVRTGAEQVGHK